MITIKKLKVVKIILEIDKIPMKNSQILSCAFKKHVFNTFDVQVEKGQ